MEPLHRIHFLDNLRAFIVFLVIVLHGAITYMAFAPSWWYVVDPESSLFFTALVLLIDVPIMPTLFFIAGYFAYPSLTRKGASSFLKDKVVRIALPWIFGVLLLAPPVAYMIYYSRDVPVTYWQFWQSDFWGAVYQQSVYWFLGILFLIFAILSVVYTSSQSLRSLQPQVKRPTWKVFVGFVIITASGFLILNLFFPLDTWTHAGYVFMFQPLRVPLYIGYFVFGMYAYQNRWFLDEGYRPSLSRWVIFFVVSGLLYVGYRFTVPAQVQTTVFLKGGNALLFNTFCLSALMFVIALFEKYGDKTTRFWKSQARNSYGVYYVHPFFLYPLAFIFLSFSISIYIKAIVIILVAALLSWAFSSLILTRLPVLRRVF